MSQKSQKSNKSRKSNKSKNSQKSQKSQQSQQSSDRSQTSSTSRKTGQEPDGINGNKMPSSVNKRQISTSPKVLKVPSLQIPKNGRSGDVSEVSGSVNDSNKAQECSKED
jgi:hypothetical protein